MFTGLVQARRPIVFANRQGDALDLAVELGPLGQEIPIGASVAIDGCCLTVTELQGTVARFHAGAETLLLTHLARRGLPRDVNVERSLRFGDELGGHLVSGHVDGLGEVVEVRVESSQTVMGFQLPPSLFRQTVGKGSITIDGVSLTLAERRDGIIDVALIPHTLTVTTLSDRRVGDLVNIETDLIGKWILTRMELTPGEPERRPQGIAGDRHE